MRIALVAPLVTAIAQPYLGGAQAHVAQLAQGLQKRGHSVTLFAREGSEVPNVGIEPVQVPELVRPTNFLTSSEERYTEKGFFENFLGQAEVFLNLFLGLRQRQHEFELIHAHAFDWPSFTASCIMQDIPVMHTLHLPAVVPEINEVLRILERRGHPLSLVTVSQACARTYEAYTSIDRVIYNGLDLDALPFREQVAEDAPLLVAGRIAPEKGIDAAIAIAERAGKRLVIAGGIYDQVYYRERVAPLIERASGRVSYVGHLEHRALWKLMSEMQGLLFPIAWDEPFGLAAVEAMATGTPVIAYERGAASEIIRNAETGFLVPPGDIERAAEMVEALPTIRRKECRRYVEENFSQETMLDRYEEMYVSLVKK
jgi:UDP-glucose:tetrahydrobiopterin glucosyltransferase